MPLVVRRLRGEARRGRPSEAADAPVRGPTGPRTSASREAATGRYGCASVATDRLTHFEGRSERLAWFAYLADLTDFAAEAPPGVGDLELRGVAVTHCPSPYASSLVVKGRRCLVVGGGPVALRKVQGLLRCGAHVTVVAPRVCDEIRALVPACGTRRGLGALGLEVRRYASPEAARYQLVISATGDADVDRAVYADADAAGVWVNCADDVANCSFLLPAVHRGRGVTVAVSTGGASPALAKWLRAKVVQAIGVEVAALAELLDEAEQLFEASGVSPTALDWTDLLTAELLALLPRGTLDDARVLDKARAVVRTFVDRCATESPG